MLTSCYSAFVWINNELMSVAHAVRLRFPLEHYASESHKEGRVIYHPKIDTKIDQLYFTSRQIGPF